MSATTTKQPSAISTLFQGALINARRHQEDADDAALRRICIYYACDVAGMVWSNCNLEKIQQVSNNGHRLASILIADSSKEDPIQTEEVASNNREASVDTFLRTMANHRTELSPNAFLMMQEFKITQPMALELMSIIHDSICKIIER